MNKQITTVGILIILFLVILNGCLESSKDSDSLDFSKTIMSFSKSKCNSYNFQDFIQGINETKWLNKNTLSVKVYVNMNCAETVIDGNYTIINKKITLQYLKSPSCQECTNCICTYILYYNFTNIPKNKYDFELESIIDNVSSNEITNENFETKMTFEHTRCRDLLFNKSEIGLNQTS